MDLRPQVPEFTYEPPLHYRPLASKSNEHRGLKIGRFRAVFSAFLRRDSTSNRDRDRLGGTSKDADPTILSSVD